MELELVEAQQLAPGDRVWLELAPGPSTVERVELVDGRRDVPLYDVTVGGVTDRVSAHGLFGRVLYCECGAPLSHVMSAPGRNGPAHVYACRSCRRDYWRDGEWRPRYPQPPASEVRQAQATRAPAHDSRTCAECAADMGPGPDLSPRVGGPLGSL